MKIKKIMFTLLVFITILYISACKRDIAKIIGIIKKDRKLWIRDTNMIEF